MGCLHPETESPKSSGKTSKTSVTNYMTQAYPQNMPFWMKAFHKVGIENVNFFGKVMVNLQEINGLKEKVVELERELQKQVELKETYHYKAMNLERDIRNLQNIAQENGFIHLIAGKPSIEDPHESIEESETEQIPTSPTSCLLSLHQQAIQEGWHINEHEIELHEQIGKGSTSDIFRGTWRGLDVAVKCIRPEFFEMHEEAIDWFCQEVEIIIRQRHPYVLQLIGACLSPPMTAWLVTELLGSQTLREWLYGHKDRQNQRTKPLPPLSDRLQIALEISQGMQYLHGQKPKVLHRDLKLSNIFLDDNHHVKLGDFGHARFLVDGELALTGETGTYVYMAPEVIKSQPYDEKSDVYSYAIILNELVTGLPPYINSNYPPPKIAYEVAEGNLRPTLPNDEHITNDALINLICCSWDTNPSKRPTFESITYTMKKIKEDIFE
ncbi:hypothetical protein SUGI_0171360 [Cryptomeria japonica]|uniref:serine/threonine-protein kinase STY17-like n=1 Tax=Cryptomeria japonica TaxID=3369 RepID=UPI002408A47C|nr:serine/threonine-protein kinase STY17-like [Cryptomeria japonica]GLJ11566.1 hypothetical protein SUGI_0171360 [Cryptomeria japonica]